MWIASQDVTPPPKGVTPVVHSGCDVLGLCGQISICCVVVRSPCMVWAPGCYRRAVRQNLDVPGSPTPPLCDLYAKWTWVTGWKGQLGQIQCTHICIWQVDWMSQDPPPPQKHNFWAVHAILSNFCFLIFIFFQKFFFTQNVPNCYAKKLLKGKHSFGCLFTPNQVRDFKLSSFGWVSGAECGFTQNLSWLLHKESIARETFF